MATRDIETFGEVHAIGDTRKPWNKGRKSRAVRPQEEAATEARFRERRRRDAEKALGMGLSGSFTRLAMDYVNKCGEFSRG